MHEKSRGPIRGSDSGFGPNGGGRGSGQGRAWGRVLGGDRDKNLFPRSLDEMGSNRNEGGASIRGGKVGSEAVQAGAFDSGWFMRMRGEPEASSRRIPVAASTVTVSRKLTRWPRSAGAIDVAVPLTREPVGTSSAILLLHGHRRRPGPGSSAILWGIADDARGHQHSRGKPQLNGVLEPTKRAHVGSSAVFEAMGVLLPGGSVAALTRRATVSCD